MDQPNRISWGVTKVSLAIINNIALKEVLVMHDPEVDITTETEPYWADLN